MRKTYTQILRVVFSKQLIRTRAALGITQEEMADRLSMSTRSYSDLDNGYSCCSGLTLALYLTQVCPEPMIFLNELNAAFRDGG